MGGIQRDSLADRVRGSRTVDLANPKPLPFGDWARSAASAVGKLVARPGVQETPYGKPAVATVKPGQPIPNDLASRPTTAPTKAPAPAPAPAAPAVAPASLPDWAHSQVVLSGGDPRNFQMSGRDIISARSPEQISQDYAAHPPITTAMVPAAVPSIGVQGAPVAAGTSARPGVQAQDHSRASADPRDMMARQYQKEAAFDGWVPTGNNSFRPAGPEDYDRHQAALAAHASSISQYENAHANFMQNDPETAARALDLINQDPLRRATYLAGKNVSAQEQAQLPHRATPGEPADTSGNADLATAGRLADPNISLMEHATHFAANPGQANTAAFQDWINKHYSTPQAWNEETYVPPDPNQFTHPLGHAGIKAAGLIHSIFNFGGNVLGAGGTSAGTGLGWQKNRADRLRLNDMLHRIGVHAPEGTVNAGIPPQ